MNAARLAPRRPIFRCLNAPRRPQHQLRHLSRQPIVIPKHEAEALIAKLQGGPVVKEIDHVSIHRAEALRRAQLVRKRNWLALGAVLSMIPPLLIMSLYDLSPSEKEGEEAADSKQSEKADGVLDRIMPRPTNCDSPRRATAEFQGKQVVIAPGDKIIAAPADAENPSAVDPNAVELVETGTSYVPYFPKTIKLPSTTGPEGSQSEAEYTLLGLGIRKVSFLRVQVYVVGLYVKTSSLSTLQNHLINTVNPSASALIPGEKEDLRHALLDADKSNEVWNSILAMQGSSGVEMALRIVPTRGTDFNHLRDGLMRGIQSRTDEVGRKQAALFQKQAAESKTIALPKPVEENEFSDESFGLAMKDLKAIFGGRGSAAKGSVLFLTRDKDGALGVLYQPVKKTNKGEKVGELTQLGAIADSRVSRLLWLLYLGGQNVSSEEARKSIVDGCIHIVERPVGTVESMVQ